MSKSRGLGRAVKNTAAAAANKKSGALDLTQTAKAQSTQTARQHTWSVSAGGAEQTVTAWSNPSSERAPIEVPAKPGDQAALAARGNAVFDVHESACDEIAGASELKQQADSPTVSATAGLKVMNSKMPHAVDRSIERAGYGSPQQAREALQSFGQNIEDQGLPVGTVVDAAGHLVVPGFGDGAAVVYRQKASKLVLQTVMTWMEGQGTPIGPNSSPC